MSRMKRQSKILELISKNPVSTQEDLLALLKQENFKVTQATISRDIKELGLIKVQGNNKRYRYVKVDNVSNTSSNKHIGFFKEAVISIVPINNLVVIKTITSSASIATMFIDKLQLEQIIGSIAGEDTILLICDSDEGAKEVSLLFNSYLD